MNLFEYFDRVRIVPVDADAFGWNIDVFAVRCFHLTIYSNINKSVCNEIGVTSARMCFNDKASIRTVVHIDVALEHRPDRIFLGDLARDERERYERARRQRAGAEGEQAPG